MDSSDDDETPAPPSPAATGALGPLAFQNWRAMRRAGNGEPRAGYEVLLFGDAPATGGNWSIGPYEIMNTVSGIARSMDGTAPPLALRVWDHLADHERLPPLTKTETGAYTGVDLADEVAVLLALLAARRLRAGGMVRRFDSKSHVGVPYGYPGIAPPVVPPTQRMLPRQAQPCALLEEHRDLLASYVELPAKRALALTRAARAYRDALWIGESQPELAWLLLVSAIECLANADGASASTDPLERVANTRPRLGRLLAHPEIPATTRRAIAKEVAHLFKATEKFIDFMLKFGPTTGPEPRPAHYAFRWGDDAATRAALALVYEYRSNALHGAIAIPAPMLQAPPSWTRGPGFAEVPAGHAAGTLGGAWRTEDTPMLLHAFEFAVHHALVGWWRLSASPDGAA